MSGLSIPTPPYATGWQPPSQAICFCLISSGIRFWRSTAPRSLSIGRRVRCTVGNETFMATATGIDELGGLIVQPDEGQQRTLHSGEAKLV